MTTLTSLLQVLSDNEPFHLCSAPSLRAVSETALLHAAEVPDRAHIDGPITSGLWKSKHAPRRWHGPFAVDAGLHLRGESHHTLDGLWRRPDGRYSLMEAKGPLDAPHARHALKKLTRWMELAHGHNAVTWAWLADWWLTRHRSWERAKRRDPREYLRELEDFVHASLGRDWMDLDAGQPPAVHIVCSGINRAALEYLHEWRQRYGGEISEFSLWVLHAPPDGVPSKDEDALNWHRLDLLTAEVSEEPHPPA